MLSRHFPLYRFEIGPPAEVFTSGGATHCSPVMLPAVADWPSLSAKESVHVSHEVAGLPVYLVYVHVQSLFRRRRSQR